MKYGRLTVLEQGREWVCRCDCGTIVLRRPKLVTFIPEMSSMWMPNAGRTRGRQRATKPAGYRAQTRTISGTRTLALLTREINEEGGKAGGASKAHEQVRTKTQLSNTPIITWYSMNSRCNVRSEFRMEAIRWPWHQSLRGVAYQQSRRIP